MSKDKLDLSPEACHFRCRHLLMRWIKWRIESSLVSAKDSGHLKEVLPPRGKDLYSRNGSCAGTTRPVRQVKRKTEFKRRGEKYSPSPKSPMFRTRNGRKADSGSFVLISPTTRASCLPATTITGSSSILHCDPRSRRASILRLASDSLSKNDSYPGYVLLRVPQ